MTWFLTGFEKEGDALTHAVDVDEALRSMVTVIQADESDGANLVLLNPIVVQRLGEVLDLDLNADRADYVLEYFDPGSYYDVKDEQSCP